MSARAQYAAGKQALGQRYIFSDQTNLSDVTLPSQSPEGLSQLISDDIKIVQQPDFGSFNLASHTAFDNNRAEAANFHSAIQNSQIPQSCPSDTNFQSIADVQYRESKHDCSVRCLKTCTTWKLEIQKTTEDQGSYAVGEFENPAVTYKKCSFADPNDLLDQIVQRDRQIQQSGLHFSAQKDIFDSTNRDELASMKLAFPVKNKTKSQNQVLTNFQFEPKLKQETFLLTFDIGDSVYMPVDSNLSNSEFLFNINGTVHGQQVFSDGIFYMFKGGKMLNCCLSQINRNLIQQIVEHQASEVKHPLF